MEQSITIAFTFTRIKKIKSFLRRFNHAHWVFLGKDFKLLEKIEKLLGPEFIKIDFARIQDEAARDVRFRYIHWIDKLNDLNSRNWDWWFSTIASHDPGETDIFQFFCYLETLDRLGKKNSLPELIIVESPALSKLIWQWAKQNYLAINIIDYKLAGLNFFKRRLGYFIKWIKFSIKVFLRWAAAYLTRKIYGFKRIGEESSILVSTFMLESSMAQNGVFQDRFFPYLHEFLAKKGFNIVVSPVLYGFRYNFFSVYKKMRKSKTLFIIPEDYLRLGDYFFALMYPFRLSSYKIKVDLFGRIDAEDMICEELKTKFPYSSLNAMLVYRLFLRIMLKPKAVILWYENQAIDKALIAGMRNSASRNVQIIGAQLFIHSPNLLGLFPIESEYKKNIVPDLVLASSDYQCAIIKTFTNKINCNSVSSLRYSHIFSNEGFLYRKSRPDHLALSILLPIDISEALELLGNLNAIIDRIEKKIKIVVKGHPSYRIEEVINQFGKRRWPSRFEIFEGSMKDILENTTVAIGSNSSSMIESIVRGIPVVLMNRQSVLNSNILENSKIEMLAVCYSKEEMAEAIKKFFLLSMDKINEFKKTGEQMRDMYFKPLSDDGLMAFLPVFPKTD